MTEATLPQIRRVAVLGAGTMGHGIAQVCAMGGYTTALYDLDLATVIAGHEKIRKNLEKGVQLGKVADATRETAIAALRTTTDLAEACEEVDLVIEAAPESMELKKRIFFDVEGHAPETATLATNTSSLSITEIATALRDPTRLLGLHFFNPVFIMKLVEVVHGEATGADHLERAITFVARIDKEPITVKDTPGFASSRLGVVLGMEAIRMVEEGVASAKDIDTAMELGYRHPMGPLRLTDLVGLDVRLGIASYLHRTLGSEAFRPPELLKRMVEEGKLGKKSGEGFYDWREG